MPNSSAYGHPEILAEEIFLGNFKDLRGIGWKTKRLGTQAYDVYDKPIKDVHPVFVQVEEIMSENPGIVKRLERQYYDNMAEIKRLEGFLHG